VPTIEIVSVDSKSLNLDQKDFGIAIIEENKLESHRSLFNDFLNEHNGVIIHMGNPEFIEDKDGCFFANMIIDWEFEDTVIQIPEVDTNEPIINTGANQLFKFKILDKHQLDIDSILKIAINKSPIKKVYFLSDYQFGPDKPKTEIIYTIKDFWERHDNQGLAYNTLYELYG
jgi:hypothetical protein